MIKFFDIMFLSIRRKYIKQEEKDMPGLYALCLVSIFQVVNIFALWITTSKFLQLPATNKIHAIVLCCVILLGNYLRYYQFSSVEQLESTYKDRVDLPSTKRNIWIYEIVSVLLVTLLVILKPDNWR